MICIMRECCPFDCCYFALLLYQVPTLRHPSHTQLGCEIRIKIWRFNEKNKQRSAVALSEIPRQTNYFLVSRNMRAGKLLLIHLDTLKSDSNNIIRLARLVWLIDLFCAAEVWIQKILNMCSLSRNSLKKLFVADFFAWYFNMVNLQLV